MVRTQHRVTSVPFEPSRIFAYSTAIVKQGKTHFFADLYGQDKLLDRALRQQSEQRRLRARPGL